MEVERDPSGRVRSREATIKRFQVFKVNGTVQPESVLTSRAKKDMLEHAHVVLLFA